MTNYNIIDAVAFALSISKSLYPTNPDSICNELDIQIKDDKPLGKDGYLICTSGKKVILVNSDIQNRHRRKFIIAHELGHFLLHSDSLYMCNYISEITNQNINTQTQEREANEFASEVLVPSEELQKDIPIRSIELSDVCNIANKYDVSVTHAAIRALQFSNAENEILICYDKGKRKWYSSSIREISSAQVPLQAPFDLSRMVNRTLVTDVWDTLFEKRTVQEVFHAYGEQYLVLLHET